MKDLEYTFLSEERLPPPEVMPPLPEEGIPVPEHVFPPKEIAAPAPELRQDSEIVQYTAKPDNHRQKKKEQRELLKHMVGLTAATAITAVIITGSMPTQPEPEPEPPHIIASREEEEAPDSPPAKEPIIADQPDGSR